jgi:hypothetical protein
MEAMLAVAGQKCYLGGPCDVRVQANGAFRGLAHLFGVVGVFDEPVE